MDAFARWFGILRERGELLDFKVTLFDSPEGPPVRDWTFAHERYDGARMMETILADLGTPLIEPPRLREATSPSFLRRLRALLRELTDEKREIVPWRRFDAGARGRLNAPSAHTLFGRDEVATLTKRAADQGARLNSLLLWALDRAVYGELAHPSPTHRWAVPVNMRGALGALEKMNNVASAVAVDVPEDASPAEVKNVIRAQLERNAHWGAWDAFRLLGYLGMGFMRRYAVKYYARPGHAWLGTFTNVGPYDAHAGWLCLVPPVTRTHPIGAGATYVGDRLSLGLQLHSALGPTDLDALMRRWRELALGVARP